MYGKLSAFEDDVKTWIVDHKSFADDRKVLF